jgi:serine/threonine protein kinase
MLNGTSMRRFQEFEQFMHVLEGDCATGSTYLNNVYELLHDSQNVYIVSEYAPGSDMRKYLLRRKEAGKGKITEQGVRLIAKQLLSALDSLHSKRIVHNKVRLEKLLIYKVNRG